jgi:diguanylate cyclase (GGDEF)-like protein
MTRVPSGCAVLVCAAILVQTAAGITAFAAWQDIARAQTIAPELTVIDVGTLAGVATLLVAVLLSLLYFYRRRVYILCWVAGWILIGASRLLAAREFAGESTAVGAYGLSQFLAIVGALVFVLGADAYRTRLRLRRKHALVVLSLLIWFGLSPLALGTVAVFVPGHLLAAGGLAAAGVAHLRLLRDSRLVGAAVIGSAMLLLAASHAWLTIGANGPSGADVERTTFVSLALYLVTALGMQLMAFEDMTYELRLTNRRLESTQGELRQLVTTDPLTGCRNRRFFSEIIGREIQRHRRYHIPLSLVFVDVDRFKAINDTLGHEAGDRVLQRVAVFLVRNVREADYVFRWGGDEFLILISCREEEAVHKGRELQTAFAQSSEAASLPAGVGLSVGCAEVPATATEIMAIVKIADERMYLDKRR